MNLWILKHDTNPFSKTYLEELENYSSNIPQLKEYKKEEFSSENLHFLSFSSAGIPKTYNQITKNGLKGYSGLLIDKSAECKDVRNIENVEINPENYYGQFSVYQLKKDFDCFGDVLGFHKVFYGQKDGRTYISNSFEFLKKLDVFEINIHQMLKDFSTTRFGIFPGYNTLLKDVVTLPEYGSLKLTDEGELKIYPYKNIAELFTPTGTFEQKLTEAVNDYRSITHYLRKYHSTAIGLSGGFDGRLILNMFHGTSGKSLETFTYNRAGKLDLYIASILSKKANVPHHKFVLKPYTNLSELKVSAFKDSVGDPFTTSFRSALKDFYKSEDGFKVVLGGNGGDTDWEFGEKRIADVDKSSLKKFIHDYSLKLSDHTIFSDNLKQWFSEEIEAYLLGKYGIFAQKNNWQQLLGSAFFHLERFRGEQGFKYSQNSNKNHDVFTPFAIESFNQLVFLATKEQLQRGLRKGIQYRLSDALTNGEIPYAPILTSINEHGNGLFQRLLNRITPYLPKIIWKLNNGDTNTRMRRLYQSQVNGIYADYISENSDSKVFDFINKEVVLAEVEKQTYKGTYNDIGSMIKTIEENQSP